MMRIRGGETKQTGFTLIEIIVGMAILGVLMTAIGSALIVGLRTYLDTGTRLSENHDAQISSAYLANDVQSAMTITVPGSAANCSGGSTTLVSFAYAGGQTAAYACGFDSKAKETQVTRSFAGNSVVIAHFAGSASPTVTCTGCGTSAPARVQIVFAEASGYSYTLVGSQRRNPGSTSSLGAPPDAALFVLGGGSPLWVSGSCPAGQIDNPGNPTNTCTSDSEVVNGQPTTPKLTVLGNLFVNASMTGAVRLSGQKNQVKLDIEPNTSGTGDFKILSGGTCTGCTSTTVKCPSCTTSPPPGSYPTPLLDPLRFMTAPDETGLSVFNDGNYHGPGVYTSTLRITSSTTFAAGPYILGNGISVTGSSTISVTGVSPVTGNGVMLYNKSGSISFAGSSTISLAPPTTGQYKGIIIFQSRTNTSAVTLSGGSGISPIGIVYAPASSSVTLGTGGASLRVSAVVGQNIKVSGSAQVTIG